MIPESFRLNVSSEGKPTSISYNFEMGDGFYIGKETIEFSLWGNATLPSNIDFSNIGAWKQPANWKEELTSENYQILVDMFGEEFVLGLPYLYSNKIEGSWRLSDDTPEGYKRIHIYSFKEECPSSFTKNYYEEYYNEFINYLQELGYQKSTDNNWGIEAWAKGEHHIRVGYVADQQIDLFVFDNDLK